MLLSHCAGSVSIRCDRLGTSLKVVAGREPHKDTPSRQYYTSEPGQHSGAGPTMTGARRMSNEHSLSISRATPNDAQALARLIDIAGEGIPAWLWEQSATEGKTPLAIGIERARRHTGGFSYSNAMIAKIGEQTIGMVLSYLIHEDPCDNTEVLPKPIVPFVQLEKQSVGSWYINALAVHPEYQGRGIGSRLLQTAEELGLAHNVTTISIQVYSQNTGAVRLYQRLGFTQLSSSPVLHHPCQPYYTGDVLLLIKSLDQ